MLLGLLVLASTPSLKVAGKGFPCCFHFQKLDKSDCLEFLFDSLSALLRSILKISKTFVGSYPLLSTLPDGLLLLVCNLANLAGGIRWSGVYTVPWIGSLLVDMMDLLEGGPLLS